MLKSLFRSAEFDQLLTFVSPALFSVMPLSAMFKMARQLSDNYRNTRAFGQLVRNTEDRLLDDQLRLTAAAPQDPEGRVSLAEAPPTVRHALGQQILGLYFRQLYHAPQTILDLRPITFRYDAGENILFWQPKALYLTWEPTFLDALRRLYDGFYRGDDALFSAALDQLHLRNAEDSFRAHFGAGDQHAVVFRMRHFIHSFEQVFLCCKEARETLPADFLALGFYLAALYESLELLGGAYDVFAAYHAGSAA